MKRVMCLLAVMAIVGLAQAGTTISNNISGHETWAAAGSPYHLDEVIYVLPGASLTIEAGTVVASFKVGFDQGEDGAASLIVCNGAQIFVNGTAENPVIMTSAEDVATWQGSQVTRTQNSPVDPEYPNGYVSSIEVMGDPKTGYWRPQCLEWGSLAICGDAYISASHYKDEAVTWIDTDQTEYTNTKYPSAMNKKRMEGTDFGFTGDTKPLYGGANDDDDSGSISYLSLRYGGRLIEDTDELNGLSLGGIGRGTDIHHVEVMNNIDDGIEIWGGTVELSHVNVWNIGDDSIDVDEGWRGSIEYGLIVQGYSKDAAQGSGIGDNCFEMDGAEDVDAQPMTTARISKFTVVGQPKGVKQGGDAGTAWRDNARVQFDNCIWMDLDDEIIKFDNADGDGAQGYDGTASNGLSGDKNRYTTDDGTLTWVQHWTTSYNDWAANTAVSGLNLGSSTLAGIYEAYMSIDPAGKLCQITDSVFYNIAKHAEYDALVADGANLVPYVDHGSLPIRDLQRGPEVLLNGNKYSQFPVTSIDPLPADGVTAGAFAKINWLASWTAVDAYGMTDTSMNAMNGDVNVDGQVDLKDFMVLSENWLQ